MTLWGKSPASRLVVGVARVVTGTAILAVPVMAGAQLTGTRDRLADDWAALRDGRVTEHAIVVVASAMCLVCWAALLAGAVTALRELRRSRVVPSEFRGTLRLVAAVLGASTLAMIAGARSQNKASDDGASAVAVAAVLGGVALAGRTFSSGAGRVSTDITTRVALSVEPDRAAREARVMVRVYGSPLVEGPEGRHGVFRKRRALELLVWLALNRERPLRSAARTAIWDVDVSDSSFATVVSEMRRGLSELVPDLPPQHWSPPSYGDSITLSTEICTDADVIETLLRRFRQEPAAVARQLAGELSRIRDLPFAGAGYLWPDLDGTTTRLVLLAFTAIDELVSWSLASGSGREMAPVVAAGLRMIPGSEEMLDLQRRVSGLRTPKRAMTSLRA